MTYPSQMDDPASQKSPGQLIRVRVLPAGILVLAAILYFSALGKTPLRVNAEIRCHDIVATMLQNGDFVVPVYAGETRFNKPPLFYWTTIAVSRIAGHFSVGVLRFPSAVAALGILALGLTWGRLLNARRESLLAIAVLAVTYLFVIQARRGSFEMLLALSCNAAQLLLFLLSRKRSVLLALAVSCLFGIAFLTKATPAILFVPLVGFVWFAMMGRWRDAFRGRVLAVAIPGIAVAVSWYVFVILFRPDSRATILSELELPFGVVNGKEHSATHAAPFWFYLTSIWRAAFPLSAFLPVVALNVIREKGFSAQSPWRLLLLCFLLPLAVFSMIPMKQDHYLLPTMLPLALLAGRAAFRVLDGVEIASSRWVSTPVIIPAIVVLPWAVVSGIGLYYVGDWNPVIAAVFSTAAIVLAAFGILWTTRTQWNRALGASVLCMGLMLWAYFTVIRPVEDGFGSGAIYRDTAYDSRVWDSKFKRFPYLRVLLDVDKGLKREKSRFAQTTGATERLQPE